jgi:hypothetical protein
MRLRRDIDLKGFEREFLQPYRPVVRTSDFEGEIQCDLVTRVRISVGLHTPLAQSVEREAFNLRVAGSSPARSIFYLLVKQSDKRVRFKSMLR